MYHQGILYISSLFLLVTCSSKSAAKKVTTADVNVKDESRDKSFQAWSSWSSCDNRCMQTRIRSCRSGQVCKDALQEEKRACSRTNGKCTNGLAANISSIEQQLELSATNKTNRKVESAFFDLLYSPWSTWSVCNRACKRSRYRTCRMQRLCRNTILLEERRCYTTGNRCQKQQASASTSNTVQSSKKDHHGKKVPVLTPTAAYNTDVDEEYPDDDIWLSEEDEELSAPSLPDVPSCGRRFIDDRDLRIVGGKEAIPGSWDWQVAIMTPWHEQFCGGVLIAPRWVLTAAHCVMKKGRKRKVVVRIGDHHLKREDKREDTVKVEKYIIHPKFNLETVDSDIALLMLSRPAKKASKTRYVCVPNAAMDDHFPEGTSCYLLGWGKMQESHATGTHALREATVPIVERQKCINAFDYVITSNQFCGGYEQGGVDTCTGDSGGPLLCAAEHEKDDRRWYVYGITSFGEGCGERGKYGVYTKVSKYFDWISKMMIKNSRSEE